MSTVNKTVKQGSIIRIKSLPKTNDIKHLQFLDTTQTVDEIEYGNVGGIPSIIGVRIKGFPLYLNPSHYEVI